MRTNVSKDTCPICIEHPLEDSGKISDIAWVQCDICAQWFHSQCLKLPAIEINNLHSYHCSDCSKIHGPSIQSRKSKRIKTKIDYVALNDGDVFAVDKSSHPHVPSFHEFPVDANKYIETKLDKNPYIHICHELSKQFALQTRMEKPILVPSASLEVVGMELPIAKEEITLDFITDKVGQDEPVEVMDVLSQQGVRPGWNMGRWRDYFQTDELSRDRIRNVISLEISQVNGLGDAFKRPQLVRDMDLVDKVWDQHDEQKRSKVTKYCLMSVKHSFTDFHIDFGGTSVYYTVCSGSKTFLMFPPTDDNLELYKSWCLEPNQNFIWFATYEKSIRGKRTIPSEGFKVTLSAGDLFIIPSGWIHSVYTPEDSIVIGGNYLTLRDMRTQLKISRIEKETKVPSKFRFPMFNKVLWLSSWYYLNHKEEFLADINPQEQLDRNIEVKEGYATRSETAAIEVLQSLIDHLKSHFEISKTSQVARRSIPTDSIGRDVVGHLIKLETWLSELIPICK
ncbi:uncharacterized protein RJT20DRAFT_64083 [Scheffersomyces xylosifermentans]|uniref:uncharacterized protein n=1 Tax=Scheffersomyces xylosifermentans TaxID=1304137 RepID=UPI00315D10DD